MIKRLACDRPTRAASRWAEPCMEKRPSVRGMRSADCKRRFREFLLRSYFVGDAFVLVRIDAETSSGLTSQRIQRSSGLLVRSRRLFLAGPIYAGSCGPQRAIATTSERIGHWPKMRRSLVRFIGPDASNRSPSSADSITTLCPGLSFRYTHEQ